MPVQTSIDGTGAFEGGSMPDLARLKTVTAQVIVARLTTEDVPAVRQLLVAGLTERWGKYESRLNPDIETFPASYEDAVVFVARQANAVVGTGILRSIGPGRAEVLRMSVAASTRRSGIGSLILECLLRLARESAIQEVHLETTSSWSSAVRFYAKHGFVKTHEQGDDSYFLLEPGRGCQKMNAQ